MPYVRGQEVRGRASTKTNTAAYQAIRSGYRFEAYMRWMDQVMDFPRRVSEGVNQVKVPRIGWTEDFGTTQDDTGHKLVHLTYAVPFDRRGRWFRPNMDPLVVKMCMGTHMLTGNRCGKLAENRSPVCSRHGGALHPDDLRQVNPFAKTKSISQWAEFLKGNIKVEELDDEELMRGQLKAVDGSFKGQPPKMIPRDIHDRMVKEIFARADSKLRDNLLEVASMMTRIATGDEYEVKDRIKAAQWVWEQVRGKVPVKLEIGGEPWKDLLAGITQLEGGSREEARVARRGQIALEASTSRAISDRFNKDDWYDEVPIDAEVVPDPDPT